MLPKLQLTIRVSTDSGYEIDIPSHSKSSTIEVFCQRNI